VIRVNGKKLLRAELIGLEAEVVDSKNKANIGIKGKIEDETKNTLVITGKIMLKKDIVIEIKTDDQKIEIKGKDITKSSEERIKIR
jgi:ribonuclease P protein subunit POP4